MCRDAARRDDTPSAPRNRDDPEEPEPLGVDATGSEMDADVKGRLRFVLLVGHGGGCWGLATGALATTTVTLRCAGRDRRTVSGRELPRTRVASRDRMEPSRVLRRFAPVAGPQPGLSGSGGEGLLSGRVLSGGLVGHLGPQEAGELAGDCDGHDGGALALQADEALTRGGSNSGGRATFVSRTQVPRRLVKSGAHQTVRCTRAILFEWFRDPDIRIRVLAPRYA